MSNGRKKSKETEGDDSSKKGGYRYSLSENQLDWISGSLSNSGLEAEISLETVFRALLLLYGNRFPKRVGAEDKAVLSRVDDRM
ncbi:MAG: hypothetical protein KC931_24440, partial [Candidatus Omnitrophica bacterium]|nr:hypothetical protein [Candidatus Omnitrophota bacterium]